MDRVSATNPCPVCTKPDWCLIAPDRAAAICSRVTSERKCGDAGWWHRVSPPPIDWPVLAARYAGNLVGTRKEQLAAELGLPPDALDALPLIGYHPDDPAGPCWTFPEVDAAGAVIGILRRFLPDVRRKKMRTSGGHAGLAVPADWRKPPGPVFLVEGPSDVLAMTAAGLPAVGRPSNRGGVALLAELLRGLPPDRPILVVGENDQKPSGLWPGRDGAQSVARGLRAALGRPVLWALPPDGAKDSREWLTAAGHTVGWPERGQVYAVGLAERAAGVDTNPPADAGGTGHDVAAPTIRIGVDEHRANDEAVAALAAEPNLYERAGGLVYVIDQEAGAAGGCLARRPAEAAVIRDLQPPLLRERLTRCARWESLVRDEWVPAHPPLWCVQAVAARGRWPGVRRLEAVVPHPALLRDGSILTARGYDPASGLLLCAPGELVVNIPPRPTREDVTCALGALQDVVSDFPFEAPAHRAAWVAALLTPLAWFAFDGPAPLVLIDKNVRGAGAGLLADVIALILTGRRFPVMTYTPDREELRKRITSLAAEGERLVLLDNLAGAVGNDVLDAALTSDRWKDRLLGSNRVYDGPLNVCWFATGNNVQLHADTARRVSHVRMESAEEKPELRTGFRYPDLRAHVLANRGRLLSAALTVLRGWVGAGRPRHGLPPWGSFEGWSGVVREAVVFAGLPDPGAARAALQSTADRDAAAMAAVLDGLERLTPPGGRGRTVAEIVDAVRPVPGGGAAWITEVRVAIEDLCGRLDTRLLGYRFRHFARRNFGGRMLDRADTVHGATRWVVVRAGGPPPADPRADGPAGGSVTEQQH